MCWHIIGYNLLIAGERARFTVDLSVLVNFRLDEEASSNLKASFTAKEEGLSASSTVNCTSWKPLWEVSMTNMSLK